MHDSQFSSGDGEAKARPSTLRLTWVDVLEPDHVGGRDHPGEPGEVAGGASRRGLALIALRPVLICGAFVRSA